MCLIEGVPKILGTLKKKKKKKRAQYDLEHIK